MKHYRKIIIGGSFYGCGAAAREPAETLVLEASGQLGSDWVYSFLPGTCWEKPVSSPEAAEFLELLQRRGGLIAGRLHNGLLAPLFAGWCLAQAFEFRLNTSVISRRDNRLRCQSPGGISEISADEIIEGFPDHAVPRLVTALLQHPAQTIDRIELGEAAVLGSAFPDASSLVLPVPPEEQWQDTRKRLWTIWDNRPAALEKWRLVLVSSRYSYENFPNPVAGLDAGLRGI